MITRQKLKYNVAMTHIQIFASWTFLESYHLIHCGNTFLISHSWAHITEQNAY